MIPLTSTLSSPSWPIVKRVGLGAVVLVTLSVAGRLFIQIEHDGGTRWLVFILCVVAALQAGLSRQYLLAIACYTLLICYWLLFIIASGALSLFGSALLATALCAASIWLSRLWQHVNDIALPAVILCGGIITSSYLPASLIVSTTVAIVPFVLLLPLTLTKERCSHFQYLTLLGIMVLAAWSVTSSAILFT